MMDLALVVARLAGTICLLLWTCHRTERALRIMGRATPQRLDLSLLGLGYLIDTFIFVFVLWAIWHM
jgi:hypothetical protein